MSFSWLMMERVVHLGAGLVVGLWVARHLGPEQQGLLSYVLAYSVLATPLLTLGINAIVAREIVRHPEDEGRILGAAVGLRMVGALLSAVLCWGIALWLNPGNTTLAFYVALVNAAWAIGALRVVQFWFQAHYIPRNMTIAMMVVSLSFAMLRIGLILLNAPLGAFVYAAAGEIAVFGIAGLAAYLHTASAIRWRWHMPTARGLLRNSWMLAVSELPAVVYLKIDILMLAHTRTASEVGHYAAAARLSEAWYVLPIVFASAILPRLISLRDQDHGRYNQRLQEAYDLLACGAMLVAMTTTVLADDIISFLLGPAYAPSALILIIHIWAGVFMSMRALLAQWLIAEDLYVFSIVTQSCGALINIALNLILIPSLGGTGAAMATVVSYAVASFGALFLSRRTRPAGDMMVRALFWPLRIASVLRTLRRSL
ncbi:MAG: hypothetical protein VR70_04700 [Rhodospirillaceae bacterium BRH_c57]|nr:MAG: hypothetical protein VR70_04700 [Rhodospirillaceae bacterium BRH_c57]